MSGKVSSSEQVEFGFLVPVIFAAVLLLSALVLYLIFRHNRRTVRVEAPTTSRTRSPLRHNIATQRREHREYRVDNSDSRHEETLDSKEKTDERIQTILQSIICKNLNGVEGANTDEYVVNDEEEGHVTSKFINEMSNVIVSSAVSDEVLSKSQTNGTSLNTLNVYSTNTCSICCESYHSDDSIAWSKSNSCYHIYHEACIINWLLKHDECPLCRRNYISSKK